MLKITDLLNDKAGWGTFVAEKTWLYNINDTRKRIHTFCSHLVFKAFTQINLFTLSTEPATDAMSFSSPI